MDEAAYKSWIPAQGPLSSRLIDGAYILCPLAAMLQTAMYEGALEYPKALSPHAYLTPKGPTQQSLQMSDSRNSLKGVERV